MKRDKVRCDRCEGPLSFEHFGDATAGEMQWAYDGWRCLLCGEVIDSVILFNRGSPKRRKGWFRLRKKAVPLERALRVTGMRRAC